MEPILNLTQHWATPAQKKQGVFEPPDKPAVKHLLTFPSPPSREEIERRAEALAEIAASTGAQKVMVGAAQWLVGPLTAALVRRGMDPLFAFTQRVAKDALQPDGSVKRVFTFKHAGWVKAAPGGRCPACGARLQRADERR